MALSSAEKTRRHRTRLRERALTLIGDACVFCGERGKVHAAHVMPTGLKGAGRGFDRRWRDVLGNPESYRPMCARHHQVFDRIMRETRPAEGPVDEEPIPF